MVDIASIYEKINNSTYISDEGRKVIDKEFFSSDGLYPSAYGQAIIANECIKTINALNEVVECYNISGEFDFMLKVVEENMDSYYDFHVNRLSQIENIGNVQSVFVMGVIKQTHQLVW